MSDREKLIELLEEAQWNCYHTSCRKCTYAKSECRCEHEQAADHLISNGVTVQKWIPVSERLPDLIPCDAGTAYSEAVNVLTSGRKVLTAIWDGFDWTTDAEFWDAEDEVITHWTPVLLPLPEPPKECE